MLPAAASLVDYISQSAIFLLSRNIPPCSGISLFFRLIHVNANECVMRVAQQGQARSLCLFVFELQRKSGGRCDSLRMLS